MDDVATLISYPKVKNSIGEYVNGDPVFVTVFGTVSSISRAEWYEAGKNGMNPEILFITPLVNYSGQKIAELNGNRYAIYRTYMPPDSDSIELYLTREAGIP